MTSESSNENSLVSRLLGQVERIGNKLPDPAILFLISIFIVWILSALMASIEFTEINPRDGLPIRVQNLLTGTALTTFLSKMVGIFTSFAPLGVVLVAMLGVGVADGSGYIHTAIKNDAEENTGLFIDAHGDICGDCISLSN